MMKTILRLVLLLALVAIGYFGWTLAFPNPKHVIRKRLEKVAALSSFTGGAGNISRTVSIERLGGCFAEDAQIAIDIPGVVSQTMNKAELMQSAMVVRSMARGLKAELLDMDIELGTGGDTALVDTTLKAKLNGDSELVWQELKFTMKKINGDWLISRIETVKTLKP